MDEVRGGYTTRTLPPVGFEENHLLPALALDENCEPQQNLLLFLLTVWHGVHRNIFPSTGSETDRADPQQTSKPGGVRSTGWGCV